MTNRKTKTSKKQLPKAGSFTANLLAQCQSAAQSAAKNDPNPESRKAYRKLTEQLKAVQAKQTSHASAAANRMAKARAAITTRSAKTKFAVTLANGTTHQVTGYKSAATLVGIKSGTLRNKISKGDGVYITKRHHEGEPSFVKVERIPVPAENKEECEDKNRRTKTPDK